MFLLFVPIDECYFIRNTHPLSLSHSNILTYTHSQTGTPTHLQGNNKSDREKRQSETKRGKRSKREKRVRQIDSWIDKERERDILGGRERGRKRDREREGEQSCHSKVMKSKDIDRAVAKIFLLAQKKKRILFADFVITYLWNQSFKRNYVFKTTKLVKGF